MKQDSSLDFLRDAAGHLLRDGVLSRYLTSSVETFWGPGTSLPAPGTRVDDHRVGGWARRRGEGSEDYEPWVFVDGLRTGWLHWADQPHAGRYQIKWANGDEPMASRRRLDP